MRSRSADTASDRSAMQPGGGIADPAVGDIGAAQTFYEAACYRHRLNDRLQQFVPSSSTWPSTISRITYRTALYW